METRPKSIKVEADEEVPNVLIKQEVELQASHEEPDNELLSCIKTEDEPCHTDAEDHAVHRLTPVPQMEEYIKTELMLDEEFIDPINDSEATHKHDMLQLADDQRVRASISPYASETGQPYSRSDSVEGLRKDQRERKWKCEHCPLSFTTKTVLRNHLIIHEKDRKREFACDSCDRTFYTQKTLLSHQEVHTPGTHECKVCGKSFRKKGNLNVHIRRLHLDKEQSEILKNMRKNQATVECGVCSRSFKDKDLLRRHLNVHDKDRTRKFACNSCDSSFYTRSTLWNHKRLHSRDTYHCNVCGKHYTQKEGLQVHMLRRQHFKGTQPSKDANVPVKTELTSDEEFIDEGRGKDAVPDAEGSQQPAVDDEQRIGVATTEDSVTCEVCHNSYPGELIEIHKRLTHSDEAFKCQFCPRVYLHKSDFRKHISIHEENRTRRYACEQCGAKFLAKAYLKKHMSIQHAKNRLPEFTCELCLVSFYTKLSFVRHQTSHSKRAVTCEVCGARYLRERSLRRHMIRKHTSKTQPLIPDPPTTNDDPIRMKEELESEEEKLLDEEMH